MRFSFRPRRTTRLKFGQRRPKKTELEWGTRPERKTRPWVAWAIAGCLAAFAGTLAFILWPRSGPSDASSVAGVTTAPDTIREDLETAEEVALAFLTETDPEKRLAWVRNPDQVRQRMNAYSSAALNEPGRIDRIIGHRSDKQRGISAFAVALPSGEIRLLEVVGTPRGPKVDWDAYARHGSASWEDLWSGKAQRATVRVFCQPSSEAPQPFDDRKRWTAFRLSSPDLPEAALGFAEIGTVREAMMKKVVLGSPQYRQRFVLEVVRHEGGGEPLFEIVRCLAVGWIVEDQAVEEEWISETVD